MLSAEIVNRLHPVYRTGNGDCYVLPFAPVADIVLGIFHVGLQSQYVSQEAGGELGYYLAFLIAVLVFKLVIDRMAELMEKSMLRVCADPDDLCGWLEIAGLNAFYSVLSGDHVKSGSRGKIGLLKYLNLSRSSLRSVAPGLKAIIARGA